MTRGQRLCEPNEEELRWLLLLRQRLGCCLDLRGARALAAAAWAGPGEVCMGELLELQGRGSSEFCSRTVGALRPAAVAVAV